jgi:hypothetical protein
MPWTFYNANGQKLSSAATSINVLDIDGATDIGAAIVDADLFIIDDGAGGTNRKTAASRLKTYVNADISVHVRNSANQSIANSSMTALLFDTESGGANTYDTDTMHDTSSNTGRLVATTAGKYIITGHVRWASNNTGRRIIEIRLNGAEIAQIEDSASTTGAHEQGITTALDLDADDYVELKVLQTSGGALNSEANGSHIPDFMMNKVLG